MKVFGIHDGRPIHEVALAADDGRIAAAIIEYGAAVRDLQVQAKDGRMQRVVLGLASLDDYVAHSPHMGAIAGRFANRIRGGSFVLDGRRFQLPRNQDGKHCLHGGGRTGFGKSPWTVLHSDRRSVTLAHHSPDGCNGFPGALTATCRYALVPPATLRIEIWATTDAPTIVNLCHHSYFNLDGSADILDHTLQVHADNMTPVDGDLIPTGAVRAVAGTPYDFRAPRPVRRLGEDGKRFAYDSSYMLRREQSQESAATGLMIAHAATVGSAKSGLVMEVWTTEPACQIYDGAKVNVPVPGLGGVVYGPNAGICLEPQHVPDSPNLPDFPSTVLRPGDVYRQASEYRFT